MRAARGGVGRVVGAHAAGETRHGWRYDIQPPGNSHGVVELLEVPERRVGEPEGATAVDAGEIRRPGHRNGFLISSIAERINEILVYSNKNKLL